MKFKLKRISRKRIFAETTKGTVIIICINKAMEFIGQENWIGVAIAGAIGVGLILLNVIVE